MIPAGDPDIQREATLKILDQLKPEEYADLMIAWRLGIRTCTRTQFNHVCNSIKIRLITEGVWDG